MDYSRYKTIKIDVTEASLSVSGQPNRGSYAVSLSPFVTNRYQQGIVNTLRQKITDQTKLRIVNDNIANLRVGFYLRKSYYAIQAGSFNRKIQDASNNSSLGYFNATTSIVHVTITNNVLNNKQEFDVACNGFSGPAAGIRLPFIDQCAAKAAKETFKRILTMTK